MFILFVLCFLFISSFCVSAPWQEDLYLFSRSEEIGLGIKAPRTNFYGVRAFPTDALDEGDSVIGTDSAVGSEGIDDEELEELAELASARDSGVGSSLKERGASLPESRSGSRASSNLFDKRQNRSAYYLHQRAEGQTEQSSDDDPMGTHVSKRKRGLEDDEGFSALMNVDSESEPFLGEGDEQRSSKKSRSRYAY
ncbi:MAG: hypothetical protein A2977_03945 [Alphaproteobacteria bacterium RIFCSPLOWO2_01_FULL_45_8]|nr:MAG: hypothetical protein A2065_00370 [Alphaproteobacteria bacterium GWB1_45_5]OFW75988.1 MAG: hypothetical protein A3K20_04090 [Alphaproteobacteria bacterium GWA1_45_9]OFW89623.1 MAG: hypothetical protein A2621_01780 [Alphaproteobacteria bacterium RIFCSPHIGHO2_01_FULL_41_14]OFW96002.1 MAG: hypothetical protein A2977_03945 [Alphaproteobacteria bacterium RIFCSPLOWO2_01_FULL_45_8]HCI49060.1 hypothetical protein [Holosporales bacterium]